jgi:hypothetical protein
MYTSFGIAAVITIIILFNFFYVLREYERAVVFTLGRFTAVRGPGLIIIIPLIQQIVRVDLRTIVMDVPPQDVISRDNVSVRVNAVVYFRVVDPERAIIKVEDNGRGMLPEEMNQVFDIFYQGDYGSHKGSGLGLPLTKELISLHHGSITVSSQKNKGSIFTARLPLGKEHFTETELSFADEIQKFSSEEEEIFM